MRELRGSRGASTQTSNKSIAERRIRRVRQTVDRAEFDSIHESADAAFASECADDEREKQRVREAPVFIEPYMNPDPLSVQPGASVERCYRLFRGVGLRHLPVVDDSLRPLGVITRKDLMSSFTQDLF